MFSSSHFFFFQCKKKYGQEWVLCRLIYLLINSYCTLNHLKFLMSECIILLFKLHSLLFLSGFECFMLLHRSSLLFLAIVYCSTYVPIYVYPPNCIYLFPYWFVLSLPLQLLPYCIFRTCTYARISLGYKPGFRTWTYARISLGYKPGNGFLRS